MWGTCLPLDGSGGGGTGGRGVCQVQGVPKGEFLGPYLLGEEGGVCGDQVGVPKGEFLGTYLLGENKLWLGVPKGKFLGSYMLGEGGGGQVRGDGGT